MAKNKDVKPSARASVLQHQRDLKMARSADCYVRGNTLKFYEWLESAGKSIPDGPPVWICGDCHVGNLGPIANLKGQVEIAIRDFDQTVIGNPAHDLIRLGLSIATAARGSGLPGVMTALAVEQMVEGYEQALSNRSKRYKDFEDIPELLQPVLKQSVRRAWRQLAEERIKDGKPTIPLGKRFWALTENEQKEIERTFQTEEARRLVTALRGRDDNAEIQVLDAAFWMKGCSSLGRLRYAVLLGIEGHAKHRDLCLIDIKEASKAAAPRLPHSSMPRDNARRVVTGACKLSPFLGERMLASPFLRRSVFIRELMPQDLKIELGRLNREELITVARYLAAVVGKAHGRQMEPQGRRKWHSELLRHRSKHLGAPSWLWKSVVQLAGIHEAAYLEHCRNCATQKGA